jgi:hypothetical protein
VAFLTPLGVLNFGKDACSQSARCLAVRSKSAPIIGRAVLAIWDLPHCLASSVSRRPSQSQKRSRLNNRLWCQATASDRHLAIPSLKAFVTGFPSAAQLGHRHQLLNLFVERITLGDDLINDAEGQGILRRQEIVAVEGLFDRGVVLAGVADIDLV